MEPRSLDSKPVGLTSVVYYLIGPYLLPRGWGESPRRLYHAGSCHDVRRDITQASRSKWLEGSPGESLHKGGKSATSTQAYVLWGQEGVSGTAIRDDGAACTGEEICLFFTVFQAALSHGLGQVRYCSVKEAPWQFSPLGALWGLNEIIHQK